MLTIRSSEIEEVEDVARELLPRRASRIREGRIDGVPWFLSLLSEAKQITRRRKAWAKRRAA